MITKGAIDKTNLVDELVFTNSARLAFSHILKNIKNHFGGLNVLLPAYIGITDREGSGIFDPIVANNASYEFYALNKNLEIDINYLSALVEENEFNVLLIVHYFGICKNNLNAIRELCDTYNVILIEDCAHAFHIGMSEQKLGVIGDYSFYSVHKHLPVASGGILKINSQKFNLNELSDKDRMTNEIMKQLIQTRFSEVAEKRRSNFLIYRELLEGISNIHIMYDLDNHEIPQTFPVLVNNGLREKLYFWLMERNLPVIALYYRLIENIDRNKFPNSYEVSNSILNLPVHQDIGLTDIENLCKSIKEFFKEL